MVVVTLLTDFGLVDTYVGQVKGAVLAVEPAATLVDLTHAVPAHDVRTGAYLLETSVQAFAPGSIHLAVVDPGVGSPRRAIAIRSARGDVFVGPDNGLLLPAIQRLGGAELSVELTDRRYWRARVAATFHGRDVFGPVAGYLAAGVPLERFGAPIVDPQPLWRDLAAAGSGEIVHVDAFGNLITNLEASSLPAQFVVRLGDMRITPAAHYAAVEPGALLALVGSAGVLEIAARDASAAALTGARRGTQVLIEPV